MLIILAAVILVLLGIFLWRNRSALHLAAAHRAYQRHDHEGTLRSFALAEAAGRLGVEATASFAYMLLKDDQVEAAEDLLERALNQGRKGKAVNLQQRRLLQSYWALVLWKRNRLDEAIDLLEQLHRDGYRTAAAYGTLGFLLVEGKRWERAEVLCQEACAWDPQGKVILDNWGAFLLAKERWQEAAEVYDRLVGLEPRFPEAWYGAGLAALRTGHPQTAMERWSHALDLNFHALTTIPRATIEGSLAELQPSSSTQRS